MTQPAIGSTVSNISTSLLKGAFEPKSPFDVGKSLFGRVTGFVDKMKGGSVTYAVQLKEQADLSAVRTMPRGADRRAAAWDALTKTAAATQPAVIGVLTQMRAQGLVRNFTSYPLGNSIEVVFNKRHEADAVNALKGNDQIGLLQSMEDMSGGGKATANGPEVKDKDYHKPPKAFDENGIGWHLNEMQAPEAWKQGITGAGIRVGVMDTGIDPSHPALARAFRSDQPLDYRWDTHGDANSKPVDIMGHGEHVAGIIAGDDEKFKTGVAPGASLIVTTLSESLVEPLQFLLAPTDVNGKNPRPKLGADIISNSWGLSSAYMAMAPMLSKPVEQLTDAGIVGVWAAGNEGSGTNTIDAPGNDPRVIAVGATNTKGGIGTFSSRGRLNPDGTAGEHKPNIAAPGAAIPSLGRPSGTNGQLAALALTRNLMGAFDGEISAQGPIDGTNGMFYFMTGTSMATPAAAGAAALLLQKHPEFGPEDVKAVFERGAVDMGREGFDVMYGAGFLNIPRMLTTADKYAAEKSKAAR